MFYSEGDLKSGIDKALHENRLVACLVRDSEPESILWESDFLQEPAVKAALAANTVLLRLEASSQEASFLAALVPVPKTPTFVLIDKGNLKEYIAAGTSKERFKQRLLDVLPASSWDQDVSENARGSGVEPQPTAHNTVGNEPSRSSQAVQDVLAERSKRLAAQKKEQEDKEKAKRAEEAKARREALESAAPSGSQQSADMKYATMQKKRQREAREERARILKRIEDDKAARRENAARNQAQQVKQEEVPETPIIVPNKPTSVEVALQVRVFDGSTIKSRFPSKGTIAAHLRPFIDERQDTDVPYTFKQVLTPLPNRDIALGEEERTFTELCLSPSATLILVPVKGYISAYEDNSYIGVVKRPVSTAFGLVASGVGAVTGVLGSLWGGGAVEPEQPDTTSTSPTSPSSHMTTLRDHRPDDQQFYNGNALNFEPRRDDDDKTD